MIIQHLASSAACELLESENPGLCPNTAPENRTQMLKLPRKFQKQIQECVGGGRGGRTLKETYRGKQ